MSAGGLLRLLGEQIRARRIDAGLTQRQVGERAGIVDKYVSEIERGTRDVPVSTLHAVVERGLQMNLKVAFVPRPGECSGSTVLVEIARMLGELPRDKQAQVLEVVRRLVELVR